MDRPITQLHLTMIKIQDFESDNSAIWSNVSSGLDNILANTQYDINTITMQNDDSIESIVESSNELFFGDIVEFNENTQDETILSQAKHRFNSINRDDNGAFEGYYYTPHQLIQLKDFEQETTTTFFEDEAADYAINVDGKYIWKNITDNNISQKHSFVNECHYVYNTFEYTLNRQDPCNDFNLGVRFVEGDCEFI